MLAHHHQEEIFLFFSIACLGVLPGFVDTTRTLIPKDRLAFTDITSNSSIVQPNNSLQPVDRWPGTWKAGCKAVGLGEGFGGGRRG